MKTLAKTLFASALTAVLFTSSAMAGQTSEVKKETVKAIAPVTFNKILITGNVKLIVVQGARESISVDGDYNQSTTSIKKRGYILIINSLESTPVTIRVSVKDLQRIDASNTVRVVTSGKIDVKYLQVFLKDDAKADVKANTESLYTYITGNADLKLSGATQDYTSLKDKLSKLNLENLSALKSTTDSVKSPVMVARAK